MLQNEFAQIVSSIHQYVLKFWSVLFFILKWIPWVDLSAKPFDRIMIQPKIIVTYFLLNKVLVS